MTIVPAADRQEYPTNRARFAASMAKARAEAEQRAQARKQERAAARRRSLIVGSHDPFGERNPGGTPAQQCDAAGPPPHYAILLDAVPLVHGDFEVAALFSQLAYWFRKTNRKRGDPGGPGIPEVQQSYADLARDTGLTNKQIRRALDVLVGRALIVRLPGGKFRPTPDASNFLLTDHGPKLLMRLEAVVMAGSMLTAAVLRQICYWFGAGRDGYCRARLVRWERLWVAKTCAELAGELRLGAPDEAGEFRPAADRVRRAIDRLRRQGFVEARVSGFAGRKHLFLRPIPEAVEEAIDAYWRDASNSVELPDD